MKHIKIAITGGIGSGKSTVLSILKDKGYPTFSCDDIYKEIIEKEDYILKIEELFPTAVKNGKIDRKELSALVFNNNENLDLLNSVAHPMIMQALLTRMEQSAQMVVFAEVPLLFEINAEKYFDVIWVVTREKKDRITAVQYRDGVNKSEVENRIAAQIDYEKEEGKTKLNQPNVYILDNNVSLEELDKKINELLTNLMQS